MGEWLKKQSLNALKATGKGIVKGTVLVGKKMGEGAKSAGKAIGKLLKGGKKPPPRRRK